MKHDTKPIWISNIVKDFEAICQQMYETVQGSTPGNLLADAEKLAINLGIRFEEIRIDEVFQSYKDSLTYLFTGLKEDETEENIQARIRGNLLWHYPTNLTTSCSPQEINLKLLWDTARSMGI